MNESGLVGRRVVFVLEWPAFGGSERQALLLAEHLKKEGAEVEVFALREGDGRAAELFRSGGIAWRGRRATWNGTLRSGATLARLAAELRRTRPDVLLPFCELPNTVCGLVWRVTRATTCVWSQRDALPYTLGDRLVRRAARGTPLLVSNSEHGAGHLVAGLGASPERVRVVRNGIALPPARATREEWRARLDVGVDELVFCSLAHFYARKDQPTLLRAWREAGAPGVLVLAGRWYGRKEGLEALARELGVGATVRFPGEVDDVAGLLGAADAGVLASTPAEGCPNGVLECMAAGLPVAGTDVTGIREAVGEDGAPFLGPPGDAAALGAILGRLAADGELRLTVGEANRRRARELFGVERMLAEYVAVIRAGLAVD
jgi:glycosyltransferase involved in cell wall biosynthesis